MNPGQSGLIEITQKPTEFLREGFEWIEPSAFPGSIGTGDHRGKRISNEIRWAVAHRKLVAQLELLGDRCVTFDVGAVEIIQQAAALANHHQETAA